MQSGLSRTRTMHGCKYVQRKLCLIVPIKCRIPVLLHCLGLPANAVCGAQTRDIEQWREQPAAHRTGHALCAAGEPDRPARYHPARWSRCLRQASPLTALELHDATSRIQHFHA